MLIIIKISKKFSNSDKAKILFFLLVNVKMPSIIGILTFISRKNFLLIGSYCDISNYTIIIRLCLINDLILQF